MGGCCAPDYADLDRVGRIVFAGRALWRLTQVDRGGSVWRSREGFGDGGGAVGDAEAGEDVLQVLAHGADRHNEFAGDVGVTLAGGEQVKQFPLPGGQSRRGASAAGEILVGLVEMWA